jgi:hypothetical protein
MKRKLSTVIAVAIGTMTVSPALALTTQDVGPWPWERLPSASFTCIHGYNSTETMDLKILPPSREMLINNRHAYTLVQYTWTQSRPSAVEAARGEIYGEPNWDAMITNGPSFFYDSPVRSWVLLFGATQSSKGDSWLCDRS